MVAEMHRLEQAARLSMGGFHEPEAEPTAPPRSPPAIRHILAIATAIALVIVFVQFL